MPKFTYLLVLLCLFAFPNLSKAQSDMDPEAEFIYNGRHFVPHSPWWTAGAGYGYNFSEKVGEPSFLLDVHFRIKKKHYFGAGYMTQRERFFLNSDTLMYSHRWNKHSVNSLHAMYGWRNESLKHNFGAFIGPSLNWGYEYLYTDSLGYDYHQGYLEPGIYATLQYTYKFYYDLGLGVSMYTNITKSSQVVGLTLHFYFSTALKRVL